MTILARCQFTKGFYWKLDRQLKDKIKDSLAWQHFSDEVGYKSFLSHFSKNFLKQQLMHRIEGIGELGEFITVTVKGIYVLCFEKWKTAYTPKHTIA